MKIRRNTDDIGRCALMKICMILCVSAGLFLLAGCGSTQQKAAGSFTAAADGSYEVTDIQGHTLKMAHKPQHIVTLALSSDEMVLDMVSADHVAALNYLADDPGISTVADKAKTVPVRMQDYEAEQILSLHPDLVIVPDWNKAELIQSMQDMGLPVFVSKGPYGVEEVKEAVTEISCAIGEPEKGTRMIAAMDADLKKAAERTEKIPKDQRKTVVLISHMNGYEGKGSLFDDMCRYAGVVNGAAAIGLGKSDILSKESIIRINPDVILMPTWDSSSLTVEHARSELLDDPAMQPVKAIREKRLEQVPDAYMYCASQDITKAILSMIDAVYGPENEGTVGK